MKRRTRWLLWILAGLGVAGLAAVVIAAAIMLPGRAGRVEAPIAIAPLAGPRLALHARLLEQIAVEGVTVESATDFARYPHQVEPVYAPVPLALRGHLRQVALGERFDVVGSPKPGPTDTTRYEGRLALWVPGGSRAVTELDVPAGAVLRFGVGRVAAILGEARPAGSLVVDLACAGAVRELARFPVEAWGWRDEQVVVPPCAEATLTFRTDGPFDAHLLLAHPTVWVPATGERRPNVVVINVDTLMPWALGLHGNTRGASPRLDALAREGAVFEHTYTNGNWSKSSHASFWTSKLPGELGIGYWRSGNTRTELENWRRLRHRTLVHAFRDAGYNTVAAMSNVFASPFLPTGVDLAFDRIQEDPRHMDHPLDLIDAIERFLAREGDAPFFLFFNPETPHYKYRPPWDYLLRTGLRGDLDRDLYLGEVAYADAYVGRLLDILEAAGLAGETLVVVTSDHGEQLSHEHARAISARDDAPFTFYLRDTTRYRHGHTGYDEEMHVPWIVRGPGVAASRVAAQVQVLDQAPTILRMAGLPAEAAFRGRALDPGETIADSPVLMQGRSLDAVRAEGWKYIRRRAGADLVSPEGGGDWQWRPEELYDLAADPEEARDLATTRAEVLERMRAMWSALSPKPPELWTLRLPAANEPYVIDLRGPVSEPVTRWDDRAVAPEPGGMRVVLPAPVERDLSFTVPAGASFTVAVRRDGEVARLRGGAVGLPFLDGWPVLVGPADAQALLAPEDPPPSPDVSLWRRPVLDGGPETASAAALGDDLEEALKAWGYAK